MKSVIISQRVDFIKERSEFRDTLDHRLTTLFADLGFVPIPVSNWFGDNLNNWLDAIGPRAVVISGGNNIGEYVCRDETEMQLLVYARKMQLPVFGICRGMQMMATFFGARLRKVGGHAGTHHPLILTELASGPFPSDVNSYHDWEIYDCPSELKVIARSPDGCIEAISHATLPWEGVMWHPERDLSPESTIKDRISSLFIGDF